MKSFQEIIDNFKNNELEIGIYTSKNQDGQNLLVEVMGDCLKITTMQDNGWARINEYYRDGTTTESYTK